MLRSVGVPTRIVLGFRGFETTGEGLYEILQCHAHSWVEALIVRPTAGTGQSGWRWLTLDPTPDGEDTSTADMNWSQWWEYTRQQVASLFKNFVIEYDADQQERARYAVTRTDWGVSAAKRAVLGPSGDDWARAGLIAAGGVAAVVVGWRLIRRQRAAARPTPDPTTAFFPRLVATLRRTLGLEPGVGQTPGEFATAAGDRLRATPAAADLAEVPSEAANLYYRARFGDRPLTADERQAVDSRIDRLEKVLSAES
jgi:hypothetical protein